MESPARKVLIVDDDAVIVKVYSELLLRSGFAVESRGDGMAAIELIRQAPPDLVLLDIFMPKANGVEVLKFIRAEPALADLPVVVFSTSSTSRHIDAAWRLGANKCLAKDHFDPPKVLAVIQGLLANAKPGAPGAAFPEAAADGGEADAEESAVETHTSILRARDSLRQKQLARLGTLRQELRSRWPLFVNAEPDVRPPKLKEVRRIVEDIVEIATLGELDRLLVVAQAMDSLLSELEKRPAQISVSAVRTAGQGLDLLGVCSTLDAETLAERPLPGVVLIVGEKLDPLNWAAALRAGFLTGLAVNDAPMGLKLLEQNRFHALFCQVDMPAMGGYDLAGKVRAIPMHSKTPITLICPPADLESESRFQLKGATDMMAKAFLPVELAAKAVTHIYREALTQRPK
jgi:CheY-like chemotaxis protein